eukprot:scaffold24027_cov86-Cyclotella_meneghiniana.AAC.3
MSISMSMRKGYYLISVKLKSASCFGTITGQRYAAPCRPSSDTSSMQAIPGSSQKSEMLSTTCHDVSLLSLDNSSQL